MNIVFTILLHKTQKLIKTFAGLVSEQTS